MYFGALFGYDAAERRRRAGRLLDQVGIGGERRLQLRKFSKGMVQRVGIAQALLNDPDLVIFDEPMSGLDPLGRRDVRALILGLRDRGCTVVLQLARAERRRGALQPRRHPRARPAGGQRRAARDAGRSRPADGSWSSPAFPPRKCRRRPPVSDGSCRLARAGTRSTSPLDPPPERLLADLAASGARLVSLNPIRPTLEDLFVEQVTSPAAMAPRQGRLDESHRGDCRQRVPRIGPRQSAVQPRAVRDSDDGRVVSARSAHGRPGREDHQGSRPFGDIGIRPVHCRVHRHRPGVEGSRAPQRLQPASQADSPLSIDSRQVRGTHAHACRERPRS